MDHICFENIKYSAKCRFRSETKRILNGVSGRLPKQKLIGILGPSGSGKSTLLNILSGCIIKDSGSVNIESNRLSYIPQETHLSELLTVEETLQVAAALKMSRSCHQAQKKRMHEVEALLGLVKVANVRVKHTSGGEKKRLSIGLELFSNSSVILLDEPTTGLDSVSVEIIMRHLKSLTRNGITTVICSIHQPTAKQLADFDLIYVLAHGHCFYSGPPHEIVQVFEEFGLECPVAYNPADFVIELAAGDYGLDIQEKFIAKFQFKGELEKIPNSLIYANESLERESPAGIQMKTLFKREFIKAARHPTLTYLRLLTAVTNSLALCAIFAKVGDDGSRVWFNYNAILGFVLHLMTPSLMLTILTFPTEYLILKREQINRWYSLKWYYLANTFLDLPISMIYCVISNAIFYYFTEQPREWWRFGLFALFGFMICINAQSIGLIVGITFNVTNGSFIGSALAFVFMMFAGFAITIKDIPTYIQWVGRLSYLRYGVEGMAGSVMGLNRSQLGCPSSYCQYKYSQGFLNDIGMPSESLGIDFGFLIGFFLLLRISTYFVMKLRLR